MRDISKNKLSPKEKLKNVPKKSLIPVFLVNIIPLVGVLFFKWQVYDIVLLYWLESVIIGVFNILKMGTAQDPSLPFPIGLITKIFLIPFFMLHYNGFMFGQFIFILMLIGGVTDIPSSVADGIMKMQQPLHGNVWYGIITIFLSYMLYFIFDYLKHERTKASLTGLMIQPYKRVFIQQIVIIFGAIIFMTYQIKSIFVIILVVLKILTDFSLIKVFDAKPEEAVVKR